MIIYLTSFLAGLLGLAYWYLIRFYLKQWESISTWDVPSGFKPEISVSILIPARNEAENILNCLDSVLRQNFPASLLEIIVINDHSTDETVALVTSLTHPTLRLLQLQGERSGKKAALEAGIQQAEGTLILTTDADCLVPVNWINQIVSFYQAKQSAFIAAPIAFHQDQNSLERFQALDILGTMFITGAGIQSSTILMSNGANLAYPKAVFETVGGFSGIDHLASGDDMLLMHKIAQAYPAQIHFLKNAVGVVHTKAVADWQSFFQQRLRWATKSGNYQDWRIIAVLAMVFFLCWGILLSPILVFFWGWLGLLPFFTLFGAKAAADYKLLYQATQFFNRQDLMKHFWSSQLLHIVYIAFIGLAANIFRQYEWKGRRVQ